MAQEPSQRRGLSYPPSLRLLDKAAFDLVYARGRRSGNDLFGLSVLVRGEPTAPPRLGMSVGIKVAGNAVQRNRIRRVVREAFRLAQHRLGGLDLVVTARREVRSADNARLRAGLQSLWSRWER